MNAFANEELSVGTASATALTSTVYRPEGRDPATEALVTVEDKDIRYWTGGGSPSASSGHLAGSVNPVGGLKIEGIGSIQTFLAIGIGGTAKLKVTYKH